jgi:hypothetical protein
MHAVHLAFGYSDMRKSIEGLAMLVQGLLRHEALAGDRACAHLPCRKGWSAQLVKAQFLTSAFDAPEQSKHLRLIAFRAECRPAWNSAAVIGHSSGCNGVSPSSK